MNIQLPQLNKVISDNSEDSLFKILRNNDIPVASSCLGDGICGKCVLKIENKDAQLTAPTSLETKLLVKYNIKPNHRISCQCRPLSDVTVTSTYW